MPFIQLSGICIIGISLQKHYLETVQCAEYCQLHACVSIYCTHAFPNFVSTQDPELFTNRQSAMMANVFLNIRYVWQCCMQGVGM